MATPIYPVILSGGSGTRLWPLSRGDQPKQLMPLIGERSLFQDTVARFRDRERFAAPVVVCNESHRFLVRDQLAALDIEPLAILLEPTGRNTAPAACMAAMWVVERDPRALVLLAPSDHRIDGSGDFLAAVETARALAEDGNFALFGIPPDHAETGYGYIVRGAEVAACPGGFQVETFVEKPDQAKAEALIAAGTAYWNSGMFLMGAAALLAELERFEPRIVDACKRASEDLRHDLGFLRIAPEAFGASPSRSIDHAVMERTAHAAMVPARFAWSDVGAWSALWALAPKDKHGNVAVGDVVTLEARDCYARSAKRLVALVGVENLTVVETADAVLVARKDRSQAVRDLVEGLAHDDRSEALAHARTFRPWGSFEAIDQGPGFQVKHLQVLPGQALSLQRHHRRAEHWVVVAGTARVVVGDETRTLEANQSVYIPIGCQHRLENPGKVPLDIIEVQTGDYLGEDDIVRLDDIYGRVPDDPMG